MKQPGDHGVQGIEIDRLTSHAELYASEAVEVARTLADDAGVDVEAHIDGSGNIHVSGGFVRKAIDFRKNDMFMVIHPGGPNDYHKVVSHHNWTTEGIEVAPLDAEPGTPAYERAPDYGEVSSYGELWLDWLRGRVVPIEKETRYVRTDTEQTVEP